MIPQFFKQKFNQFINRRGKEPLPVVFGWRRIYVLPSKPGVFFSVIWLVMMMAGLNFNNNMSLMLVFLLFGLAQVALYRTFFNLRNLCIEHISAKPVFLGKAINLEITLAAEDQKYQIQASHDKSVAVTDIENHTSKISLSIESSQRGWNAIPRVKFFTRYPFGFFTVWAYCIPKVSVLVYPKPEKPVPQFPDHGGPDGDKTNLFKGDELSGIKTYQQGDPIRDIAWKKSAQSNQIWVKQFNQLQGKNLLFDFNQMHTGNLEFKLSRITAWVLAAEAQQADYQVLLPGFDSGMSSGDLHKNMCLKALALYQSGDSN